MADMAGVAPKVSKKRNWVRPATGREVKVKHDQTVSDATIERSAVKDNTRRRSPLYTRSRKDD